jgi:hypothetical protein
MKPRATAFTALLAIVIGLAPAEANARACAGVTFADTVVVGGTTLQLNGLGLREATVFEVDVFVAALYVQRRSPSAKTLLARDEPARVVLHFVRDTSGATIAEEMEAGYRANTPEVSVAKKKQLLGWLEDLRVGQSIVFSYVPGQGLEVRVAGRTKGVIAGADFASATLAVLIGPEVTDEDLRAGLLGGPCE